jgi:hypothetical protein
VRGAFYDNQFGAAGNGEQCASHFVDGTEGIAGAVNEQRRRAQLGEMRDAEIFGFTGRVQRV